MEKNIQDILQKNKIVAVVGASNNPDKYGYKIFKDLKNAGYNVIPINKNDTSIQEIPAYPTLRDCPVHIDLVNFVVPPSVSLDILQDCRELNIKTVWFQPGSSNEQVISFCEQHHFQYVHDQCIMIERLQLPS